MKLNKEKSIADAKKTHTDKNLLLANENTKKIVYLSPTVEGKKHDKKARRRKSNQLSGEFKFDQRHRLSGL